MKALPIFALFISALILSSVYLTQKQTIYDVNEEQTCHNIEYQEVLGTTIERIKNICKKSLIFTIEYKENKNVTQKDTKCIKPNEDSIVGSYFGDEYTSFRVTGYKEC
ncbi:transmembrane protein, putative (macronuclear) [Tetrahymena thermophila SB210]|uniref:Transmembrane protein, putative n=1 Tax=Tetrahymena thermophila (strain SB210) TaxID=312017 RepID=Q233L4_TETTS|nr:transmembrane protein, putative [Tetrahymena thermophila SB210]EAR91566.1 transmembrane protein, putative [Tetrahymena thermophila SB210]|eukprot:XP_001011811.1 transmembrane protein, putative [Tetrahymena thermophila SB210]